MNLTWIQASSASWEAEGPQGWQAHIEQQQGVFVAWVDREPQGPLDEDCAEAASDGYYTLDGAKAWCLDRLTGRSTDTAGVA